MAKDYPLQVPDGLVVCKKTTRVVFDPLVAGRHFTNSRWASWSFHQGVLHLVLEQQFAPDETMRFCDLGRTHHFWWLRARGSGIDGAVLCARRYPSGMVGQRLLYPYEESRSEMLKRQRGGQKTITSNALV